MTETVEVGDEALLAAVAARRKKENKPSGQLAKSREDE
jgi:hypothetical protein